MKITQVVVLEAVVSVTCLFAKVVADYDHSINFAEYHTYSWIAVNVEAPLWKDRVANAIDNQLLAKGWRKVDSGADATIVVVGSTYTERTFETWYDGGFRGGWYHHGWWGGPGFATTTVERTPVGTLHIDIFDAQSKNVIWHGDCSDTLTQNPEKDEKKLQKAVVDVFRNFPPPAKV